MSSIKTNVSLRLLSSFKTEEEKKEFVERLVSNQIILDKIVDVLSANLKDSQAIQYSRESFKEADWANKIAFELGYQKALNETIKLLKLSYTQHNMKKE